MDDARRRYLTIKAIILVVAYGLGAIFLGSVLSTLLGNVYQ
jgi:hypothetical protein